MNNGCNTGQDLKSLRGKMPDAPIVVTDLCVKVGCDVISCVTKTTTFQEKGKLSYTSETVYTDKDGVVIEDAVETACPMKVEIVTTPPIPITLEGVDCAGEVVEATGLPGQLTHVVQAPDTVFNVKLCPSDADFELSCGIDPLTEHQIQTAYRIEAGEFVLIKRWDTVTGTEWTGDPATLEGCGGKPLEAEQELFCDGGVEFLRWYVIEAGLPTGQYVDTDFSGAPYTVTDEAAIKRGACVPDVVCEPTISSATADDLSGLLSGHSVAIQKSSCCVIKVNTSAGSFIVRKGMTAYSTANFACPVTVTSVEVVDGKCTAADVIVTTQKLS